MASSPSARLDEARRRLAARSLPGALDRGRAWARRGGADEGDLAGAAQLGLVKAAASWRRGGCCWAGHWRWHVDRACRDELAFWRRWAGRAGPDGLGELIGPSAAPGDRPDLADALARLRPREREALSLRFAGGLSFDGVGAALGVSGPRAYALIRGAIGRLRAGLGG